MSRGSLYFSRTILAFGLGLGLVGKAWAPTAVESPVNLLPAVQDWGELVPAVKGTLKGLPAVQRSLPAVQRSTQKGTVGGFDSPSESSGGVMVNGDGRGMGDGSVKGGGNSMGDGSVKGGGTINATGGGGGAGAPANGPAVVVPVGR